MSGLLPPPWSEPEVPPPWVGPPADELGIPVPARLLLARTDDVAVALVHIVSFSTGVEFQLHVRGAPTRGIPDPFGVHSRLDRGDRGEDILRFGMVFSDGRRVANLDAFPVTTKPEPPLLLELGGSGGGNTWNSDYWLWPLPPPGVIGIVLEWRAEAIELTRVPLDTEPLLEAATRAEKLWPDEGGRPRLIYDSPN